VCVNFMVRDAFRKCEHKTSAGSEGDRIFMYTVIPTKARLAST
jgi:hypothetical protein